jgi:hypothetical protein
MLRKHTQKTKGFEERGHKHEGDHISPLSKIRWDTQSDGQTQKGHTDGNTDRQQYEMISLILLLSKYRK